MQPAVALLLAWLVCGGALAALPAGSGQAHAVAQAALLRASASADPGAAEQARALVQRLLEHYPQDPRSWTLKAWDEMTAHRFAAALAAVERAHRLGPATVMSLGIEADALVELGRYAEAVERVQRMLDLDPNLPALSRAAHLRFLHGDSAGAVALLQDTPVLARATAPQRGKIALQRAELHWHEGDAAAAEAAAREAETLLPGRPEALAMRARVAELRGHFDQALALHLQAQALLPSPEHALGAWRAARASGATAVERRQQRLLDGMARLDEAQGGLYRRVFIEFFGAQPGRLAEAQRLARRDLIERPDLYAHAWMAWTLLAAGERAAAAVHVEQALRLGTRDTRMRALLAAPAAGQSGPAAP
jgi:tetratricopeptide (TPR) repeat protein